MQYRVLGLIALTGMVAAARPAHAQQGNMPRAPQARAATITGQVIDVSCRLGQGLSGDSHKMCAEVCSDRGIPLAILGSDGNVYMPISTAMPGDAQNGRLRPFAEQRVRVTGRVVQQGGSRAIFIESIAAAT
ncbi:MAG: hypothetical protein HYR48_02225 [Gemmatimonadetes bacterium]|nr:hypothetical protein [Gemmatimonadota bacterium]